MTQDRRFAQRLEELGAIPTQSVPTAQEHGLLRSAVRGRTDAIADIIQSTIAANQDAVKAVVEQLKDWMIHGAVVRVLGAGRARLSASIPANRLAHGGAAVFVQEGIIPMPHTVAGGGIIAASASGKTEAVLSVLRTVRKETPNIRVVGIASETADEMRGLCHHFLGLPAADPKTPLSALADLGEYAISEVLDALVVAAGELAGFDDRWWRLGHENLGATGPYDARRERVDLLFSEQ